MGGRAEEVAPLLLGAVLTSTLGGRPVAVRVTEVEAYGGVGEDPASHAYRGRTTRNATMFGPAGRAYVYFVYGMHWCLNVVTSSPGEAAAVLVRAGEVVDGVDVARARRPSARSDRDLARGPALLAAALAVTGDLDGTDLLGGDGPLRLTLPDTPLVDVTVGPRTGVSGAGAATAWRFHVSGEPSVSRYRPSAHRHRR